ncbi:hypothetical protein [Blastomonas sp. CCH8-A3]|jgi:hypothetical protein|uniref:hypothetical protein n=1 Tax=Blastomonas sp. CCH8-A3 TaxID=1768743 RepID=UPI0012E3EDD9|nr:hypothetical protein [Blastomonas sp. CCH8-A3]
MEQQPTSKHPIRPTDLASAMGWSVPYASQVLNDKRPASLLTALSVFDRTGVRLGPLSGLSDAEIDVARRVAAPTQQDAAA